jgi:hypothetical protein
MIHICSGRNTPEKPELGTVQNFEAVLESALGQSDMTRSWMGHHDRIILERLQPSWDQVPIAGLSSFCQRLVPEAINVMVQPHAMLVGVH